MAGTAGLGPTGTGLTVSGGRDDTVMNNEFLDNGAWGMLFVPYPDSNTSSDGKTCTKTGGMLATSLGVSGVACLYDPEGDAAVNNKFSGNGTFGNPSNADFGNLLVGGEDAGELLLGQHRVELELHAANGPGHERRLQCVAHPLHLRDQDTESRLAGRQHGHDPADPGRMRLRRVGLLGLGLPACDLGGHPPHTAGSAFHAQPVRGRSHQRLVPGRITRRQRAFSTTFLMA